MATGRKTLPEHRGNLPPALRALRERLNLKQVEVVKKLGLQKNRLSQYERGETEPDFATLRWLLDAMGFDLHDLQDVVDALEGRPPRRIGDATMKSPLEFVAAFLRLFARMIAKELQTQVAKPKLKPRPGRTAPSGGKKVIPGE